MTPHPEHGIARRILELESLGMPDVMVWKPNTSASGLWEAMGNDWTITEADPVRFADELERRLRG